MKVQSLLISSLIAFQATSANGRSWNGAGGRTEQPPPEDVVTLGNARFGASLGASQATLDIIADIFGEELVEEIEGGIGDLGLFLGDLPSFLFNGAANFIVPIVNDIIKVALAEFDPLDLGIDEEIPLGTVEFSGLCSADGTVTFSLDPVIGVSDMSIDEISLVNSAIQFGFWQSRVDFTIRMVGSGSDTGFLSGVNLDLFATVCGANTQGGTSADLSIVGPSVSLDFSVRGSLGLFGSNLLVESIRLSNVNLLHDEVNTLLDANNIGEDSSVGLESEMSATVNIELSAAEDAIADQIRSDGNLQLGQITPFYLYKL